MRESAFFPYTRYALSWLPHPCELGSSYQLLDGVDICVLLNLLLTLVILQTGFVRGRKLTLLLLPTPNPRPLRQNPTIAPTTPTYIVKMIK